MGSTVKPVNGDGTMVAMVRVEVETLKRRTVEIFRILNIISRDAY